MLGYNTTLFKLIVLFLSSLTAATAGMMHALYQPIVSPSVADLGYTVTALLIVLIGGVGTLSGAFIRRTGVPPSRFWFAQLDR